MPRKSRKAPEKGEDPFDIYSTWDVRVARMFYWSFMISTGIIFGGIIVTILLAIDPKIWEAYAALDVGYQVAIVAGIITGFLLLIVLFYALFHGGILRMCRLIYKNRLLSKKYEDFTSLRWLMGITLIGLYVTIIALIIGLLPGGVLQVVADAWKWAVENFNSGHWILWLGFVVFLVVGFFFVMFILWNHAVYLVLRRVKRIKEEEEIVTEMKRESVQKMDEDARQKEYKKQTGKVATYRGRPTRGYRNWKKKMGVRD